MQGKQDGGGRQGPDGGEMSRKIPKWIFIDAKTSEAFCERCGGREKIPMPLPITAFVKWSEYFGDRHKFCKANAGMSGGSSAEEKRP
jgi:hypothetical protein